MHASDTLPPPVAWVAGATGYTGQAVIRALLRRGGTAMAHVRPGSARRAYWRTEFVQRGAEVDCTPWEEQQLAARLAEIKVDEVYALLGTTKARARAAAEAGQPAADYEAVDYGLTAMLIRAAKQTGRNPRIVYLSSAGVSPDARGAYLQTRHRVETELRTSGLPFTIARPSFITGPDREESRPMERLGAVVSDGLLGFASVFGGRKLQARYRSTTADILGNALVRLASDPALAGQVVESEGLREPPNP